MAAEQVIHPWVAAGQRQIRFGLFVGPSVAEWGRVAELAQAAEAAGFNSVWLPDHPVAHGRDCWTYLAGLAAATRRVRLGSLAAGVLFRHPVLLARVVTDVDRLSGGRAVLGLGIGDLAGEFTQLGLPFPPVRARQRALEEAVHLVRRLWAGEAVTFAGEHFRAEGAALRHGPVQAGGVPLLIAGGGERVTLRQVAQHADAANFGPGSATGAAWTVDDVRRKCAVLAGHCTAHGRPADAVLRTYWALLGEVRDDVAPGARRVTSAAGLEYQVFDGAPTDVVAHFRALAGAGIRYFIVAASTPERVRLLGERVLPALAQV